MSDAASPYTVGQTLYRGSAQDSEVEYDEWVVGRLTPRGAWIQPGDQWGVDEDEERWVGHTSRFVCRSKPEALVCLEHRSRRYLERCTERLEEAQRRADMLGVKARQPASTSSIFLEGWA